MRRSLFSIILFLSIFLVSSTMSQEATKRGGLTVSSQGFEDNGQIPGKYTCDGTNFNPPLKIENVPPGTKSLALIFDDIDAPRGSYVHWILWNMDPGVTEIGENSVPKGAVQGMNDFKRNRYGGPCPPRRAHRYVFKVYALDVRLHLDPSATKADLEKAMKGHILSQAQLMGMYKRSSSSK